MVMLVQPPSTGISVLVTKLDARSEASHTAAPCNSSGFPKRFIGVCLIMEAVLSSLKIFLFCSAGKNPGIIALTLIPWGANSRAKKCVILFKPAFVIEYVNTRDKGNVDETDEILIMLPFLF